MFYAYKLAVPKILGVKDEENRKRKREMKSVLENGLIKLPSPDVLKQEKYNFFGYH